MNFDISQCVALTLKFVQICQKREKEREGERDRDED